MDNILRHSIKRTALAICTIAFATLPLTNAFAEDQMEEVVVTGSYSKR
jgi:hypothetical protein